MWLQQVRQVFATYKGRLSKPRYVTAAHTIPEDQIASLILPLLVPSVWRFSFPHQGIATTASPGMKSAFQTGRWREEG